MLQIRSSFNLLRPRKAPHYGSVPACQNSQNMISRCVMWHSPHVLGAKLCIIFPYLSLTTKHSTKIATVVKVSKRASTSLKFKMQLLKLVVFWRANLPNVQKIFKKNFQFDNHHHVAVTFAVETDWILLYFPNSINIISIIITVGTVKLRLMAYRVPCHLFSVRDTPSACCIRLGGTLVQKGVKHISVRLFSSQLSEFHHKGGIFELRMWRGIIFYLCFLNQVSKVHLKIMYFSSKHKFKTHLNR